MRTKSNALQDQPPGLKITAPWRIATVIAFPRFRLEVTFMDGLVGSVDLSRKIFSQQAGVFARLQDISLFDQVFVEHGVVTWPGELDLAPDTMYLKIQQQGEWIL